MLTLATVWPGAYHAGMDTKYPTELEALRRLAKAVTALGPGYPHDGKNETWLRVDARAVVEFHAALDAARGPFDQSEARHADRVYQAAYGVMRAVKDNRLDHLLTQAGDFAALVLDGPDPTKAAQPPSPPQIGVPRCKTCRYWREPDETCRYQPPCVSGRNKWPNTSPDEWCAEWLGQEWVES